MQNPTQRNELISVRQFAKIAGTSKTNVLHYVRNKRFIDGVVYNDIGRPKMKMPEALEEWKTFGASICTPEVNSEISSYKAEAARIELEMKKATLIPKQDVFAALHSFGKSVRKELLLIPDNIAAKVTNAKTDKEAKTIIRNAIEDALTNIAKNSLKEFDGVHID